MITLEEAIKYVNGGDVEIEQILMDTLRQYVCHNKLFDNSKYKVEQIESIDTTGEDHEN